MSHQTESHQNDPLGALWIAAVAAVSGSRRGHR